MLKVYLIVLGETTQINCGRFVLESKTSVIVIAQAYALLFCCCFLTLTLVKKSRVRGRTNVLEPYDHPRNQIKSKSVHEILRSHA